VQATCRARFNGSAISGARWDLGRNDVDATDFPLGSGSFERPNGDQNASASQNNLGDEKLFMAKEISEMSQRPNVDVRSTEITNGLDQRAMNSIREAEIDRLAAADGWRFQTGQQRK
jgi:hypothetical protein